jgi:oligopeptidase A
MNNPLMTTAGLPPFSAIRPEQIKPAIEQAIKDYRSQIETVLAQAESPSWSQFIQPLEEVSDHLSRMWSPISHMNSVVNSPELREAYESCLPLLSELSTFVGQHQGLYQAYKALKDAPEFDGYSMAQKKTIDDALLDFELSGIALDEQAQSRYGEISKRLSELSSSFSNNVLDATTAWQKRVTDEAQLNGLPESALAAAKQAAQSKELDGYLLTLEFPSYLPVMTYADNRELRRELYEAFVTRASEIGPNAGEFDNGAIIDETLALRHELAQLLGFESYAHKSLATKMAEEPQQVVSFLRDLAKRSKTQAKQELEELKVYAQETYGQDELSAWDIAYYAEKLKQHRYTISDEALRPYFPVDRVISGLFEVVERLFGVRARAQEGVETWHPDVRFYELTDVSGEVRGSFYLDLYAREHKRGGAWMDECRVRRTDAQGELHLPVAYLTCNFNKPIGDKPALFTHDEVVTLFHEFGHGLHHMLTQVDVASVSGINGVPWDAVELPSQFLENWCWEEQALAFISGHYESCEPLPKALLDKLLAAKNFQSAMMMMRQIELALFDFTLHQRDPKDLTSVQQILDEVRAEVAVVNAPIFNRFQNGFSHIFAGGYAAGYYSYKWAEVLSSDAFSLFEEQGIFDPETGRAFCENILEMGGSDSPMTLFKAFRGREPSIDALLRHSGIGEA